MLKNTQGWEFSMLKFVLKCYVQYVAAVKYKPQHGKDTAYSPDPSQMTRRLKGE